MNDKPTEFEPIIMPPNQGAETTLLEITKNSEDDITDDLQIEKMLTQTEAEPEFVPNIIWLNVIAISLFHIIGILIFPYAALKMKFWTFLHLFLMGHVSGFGVTAGAHRLWSHRAYKAKLPLQLILLVAYSTAGMNSLLDWVRDHRVHHKFSETDADPHNSNRGFFFSHVGWLMQRKHPEVTRKGKNLDFTDITDDPLLKFYNKYFLVFKIIFCFIIPVVIPVYVWNETWFTAFVTQAIIRYALVLNATWSVNSFAHIWGLHPYDGRIRPAENFFVALVSLGEGWHNYHHVFPWDYKAAELGIYKYNTTTMLLDFFAKIGWAYDLKAPSPGLVHKIIQKYGDGSYGSKEIPYELKTAKDD